MLGVITMSRNREWMYRRFDEIGGLHSDFLAGLDTFINFASSQPMFMNGEKIKCPCKRCNNIPYKNKNVVRFHIKKYGFVLDYYTWIFQGETSGHTVEHRTAGHITENRTLNIDEGSSTYHTMVMDVAGPDFDDEDIEELPNPAAQKFYDMLKAANQELWPGCTKHSKLSLVARLMNLKAENHLS